MNVHSEFFMSVVLLLKTLASRPKIEIFKFAEPGSSYLVYLMSCSMVLWRPIRRTVFDESFPSLSEVSRPKKYEMGHHVLI